MSQFDVRHLPPDAPKAGFTFVVKQPWRRGAACRHYPTWLFYEETIDAERECQLICSGCPVRAQCLQQALVEEGAAPAIDRYGVRGGLLPNERAKLRPNN